MVKYSNNKGNVGCEIKGSTITCLAECADIIEHMCRDLAPHIGVSPVELLDSFCEIVKECLK